ncbi:MAG: hypothetical protein SGI84_11695 [Gemmatimonadota bacterium]|nr:hypothetical protein [Gemmatimonadota bacterium]
MPIHPSPPAGTTQARDLVHAFAPLHKAAFGVAVGLAAALVAFAMTALSIVRPPDPPVPLHLFQQYFTGYSVSWSGAFIGAAWAGFTGFTFGWFTAFCRNLVVAVSLFVIRTRAQLAQTRDFLDHI